ncbi:amino acid ABC transporter permease [Winkia sp. ACRQY]|uniref:amino acid ABC transporter permease n=1 Tax=unclassified Winkia TaxID=2692119 RepID=UPI001EF28F21|nr:MULTISPECIES: amino acid ABC transporter permease [unclassified Winkia]MCG7302744.1 amino acid ABC transporter permease [Winkia sp. ACRQY]MDK7905933.1 amino acid ABC transporter permease [Winkia sp. UMB0889B]MDK8225178.1 amino acid ABC transporter permease [Winkia sp. UMB750B]MDK8256632.1 amino acid ABC transporter permease [Winkia sp. UMB750A]
MSAKTQNPTRVLFDAPGPRGRRRIWIISAVSIVLIVAAAAGGLYQLWWNYQLLPEKWLPFTRPETLKFFAQGVGGTLLATAVAALFMFPIALALALGREAKNKILSKVCGAWVEVFRSLPLLLVIYAFMLALPRYGIRFSTFWLLVIPMIISCSATTAEVFRAGIRAVPAGQREAALSLGLLPRQVSALVIIPQALRLVAPNLLTQLVSLLKDSTLGYVVSYFDLMHQGQLFSAQANSYIQTYFLIALIYIAINIVLTRVADRWRERRK